MSSRTRARRNKRLRKEAAKALAVDIRTKGDALLIRQAIRGGWNVPAEKKLQIVDHVRDVAVNDNRTRMSIRGIRLILAMDAARDG